MTGEQRKGWRELCIAALEAKNPDEVLQILQELNRVLKHEEQVRHDFRHAIRAIRNEDSITRSQDDNSPLDRTA